MSDAVRDAVAAGDLSFLDEEALATYVTAQRWFGAKARTVAQVRVLETLPLRDLAPMLAAALVEVRFQPGTHEVYQVLLGFRPAAEGWNQAVIVQAGDWTVYDGLEDPTHTREIFHLIRSGADVRVGEAVGEFRTVNGSAPVELTEVRSVGVEQSNTSVVFEDALVLKLYRRLEPGPNPELELLRFLTDHGFPNIARLAGWYGYSGPLMEATLGVLQDFVPGARDGWETAIGELADAPERFLERLRRLGEVTGEMHAVLGSDSSDPTFMPEEPSVETLSLLTATVDEEIERIFLDLPAGIDALEPIAGRGEEVRERLRLLSQIAAGGRVIRHHGDYHLGQTLLRGDDWIILDFEGEPARTLPERRRKRSPLRDVAGMLRSFAYAASASEILGGTQAPEDWERRAREEFLEGYFDRVDPTLMPPGQDATRRLLSVFELEKAVYELRYELNNRPDWVPIPVAGIARLLQDGEDR